MSISRLALGIESRGCSQLFHTKLRYPRRWSEVECYARRSCSFLSYVTTNSAVRNPSECRHTSAGSNAEVKRSELYRGQPSRWMLYRRLKYTTPANNNTTKFTTSNRNEKQLPSQKVANTSSADPSKDSTCILAIAADEGRRLSELKHVSGDASSPSLSTQFQRSTMTDGARMKAQIQQAIDAANALLAVTRGTESLAPIILAGDNNHEDVTSLHRAFLKVSQLCLNLAPHYASAVATTDITSTSLHSHQRGSTLVLGDNAALDVALLLSKRAHELSLPFHLPLYQRLATAAAEHSSMEALGWILQVARWTDSQVGPIDTTFFSKPLLALCLRNRLAEAASLIQAMRNNYSIDHVEATTTKEILFLLKDLVRPIWDNIESQPSRMEQDAVEVVLLLETSIWKILDYEPLADEVGDGSSSLRHAVEAIMSTEEDAREALASLEQMLSQGHGSSDLDSDDEDEDDSLDDVDVDELGANEQVHALLQGNPNSKVLLDLMRATSGTGSNSKLSGDFDVQITRSGDQTVLSVHAVPPSSTDAEEGEEDADNPAQRRVIYSRRKDYRDIPDVASQISEANGGGELVYSKEFEKHVFSELTSRPNDD